MKIKQDVIIIGGGVIGTACAYFLSQRGVKVLLLERNHLGSGASGATAAIISISGTSGTPEALRRFNQESADLILNIEQDFDRPIEIIRDGTLYVAMNDREARDLKPAFDEVRQMGIDAQWLIGEEIHRFEPLLGPDAHTAFYHPASYHVNPFRLYEGYLEAALRRGSRVEYGVEVQEVKLNNNRLERIITNNGEYQANWVVVAGGAWTPEILSSPGIEIPNRAVLGKVDSVCRPCAGDPKTFEVDTVCIGYGLIPSVWLTSMLGCGHHYNPLIGGWVPYFDENMQTDQPGVFVAGDGAGVAGVLVARIEGTIAGLFAAVHADIISNQQAEQAARAERKKLLSLRKFRRGLDQIYRIYPDLYANITDETIVCRCEGVSAAEVRKSIRAGTMSLNDIKKRSRTGMGYCQGTNCNPVIAAILVREFDIHPEVIRMMTTRPPARPIPLSLLMGDI